MLQYASDYPYTDYLVDSSPMHFYIKKKKKKQANAYL